MACVSFNIIAITFEEIHPSAVVSLLVCFCEVVVGIGESDERHQSAPAQTAPQQAGFGPY